MQKSLAGPLHALPTGSPARWRAGHRHALAAAVLVLAAAAMLAAGLPASLIVTRLAPDESCDAGRQACALSLPNGGRLTLELGLPLRGTEPVQLRLALSGFSASRVEVSMVGVNMNMVETRAELLRSEDGDWRGDLSLPVCASGPMAWQANVEVRGWWRTYVQPFRFRSGVQ